MVDDQVEDDFHTVGVAGIDEFLALIECSIGWVDVFVVGDVIAHVLLRRHIVWGEPYAVYAQGGYIGKFLNDASDVAHAILVLVEKGRWVNLIDGCFLPPFSIVLLPRG